MITVLNRKTGEYIEISQEYSSEKICIRDTDGTEFLNQIKSQLNEFEKLDGHPEYTTYLNNMYYIIQCTMKNLSSPEYNTIFQNHVNGYFYICNKIKDYHQRYQRMNNASRELSQHVIQLRNKLLEKLGVVFKDSKGIEPNLDVNDLELVKYLNIRKYFSFFKTIDDQSIYTLFALCKLLLQSLSVHPRPRNLQWENVLSNKVFEISFEKFMSYYTDYREVLSQLPMDTNTFIYLIKTISPPTNDIPFDLKHCFSRIKQFELEPNDFFERLLTIFSKGVKNLCYNTNQIAELLWIMSNTNSTLFDRYFAEYYRNLPGSKTNILIVFFDFIKKHQINENIQNRFTHFLQVYVQQFSMKEFLDFSKKIKSYSENIQACNFDHCMVIIEATFKYFIETFSKQNSSTESMSEICWNDVLRSSLEVLPTRTLSQTSNLLIFKRLLLQYYNPKENVQYRLNTMFTNLKNCDQQLYEKNIPSNIISDKLLQDFLIDIPEEFCNQFTHHIYRDFCNEYQNNPWICFIWTRITYLSLVKLERKNSYAILQEIDKWMNNVKHSAFVAEDKLTIIFIHNLFELIIKYADPILSLPDIPCIINFIYHMKNAQIDGINTEEINNFMKRAQQEIQAILQLKGKLNLFTYTVIVNYYKRVSL